MMPRRYADLGRLPLVLIVLCSWLAVPAMGGYTAEHVHRFAYHPPADQPSPGMVNLAGDFNGWSTTATPMQRNKDGSWSVQVKLTNGIHFYKFVLNHNHWINDPASDHALEEPDGHGGVNSAVLIGPDARHFPPPVPNHIYRPGLMFNPVSMADVDIVTPALLRITCRAQSGDLTAVQVLTPAAPGSAGDAQRPAKSATWRRHDMMRMNESLGFTRWGTLVLTSNMSGQARTYKGDHPFTYILEFVDGQAHLYLGATGLTDDLMQAEAHPFTHSMTPTFATPKWAKHAVWYQIFPERFRNGSKANDPANTKRWTSNWWSTLPGEVAGKNNFYKGAGNVWKRRYGGDFQGIIHELPYLRKLGVNAIYLNPIFKSDSSHKYDTIMYRHVDDHFGFKGDIAQLKGEIPDDPSTWQWTKTDKLFLQFLADAHRQGFKVIIDGVFNHVGTKFWAFQDVLKHGRKSKFADWFDITSWGHGGTPGKPGTKSGIQWVAWDGPSGAMPVFKKNPRTGLAPGPRDLVLAIVRRWLAPNGDPAEGVDGFRLDVPQDIPHPFWVTFRHEVKKIKPSAYITGELWGTAQPWLQGDQFDATMNYPFATLCQQFFVNIKTQTKPTLFALHTLNLLAAYPYQVDLVEQNLLDSHDTDRVASMFVNPDRPFDGANRIEDNGPTYSPAKPSPLDYQRLRQEVAFQMTFPGAPMIWYGDEAGMWGPDDPSNRQPMVWQDLEPYDQPGVEFNAVQFQWYQRLIAIRRALPALNLGLYHVVLADNARNVFAFSRDLGSDHVWVVINRSDLRRRIALPVMATAAADGTAMVDLLDPREAEIVPFDPAEPESRPMLKIAAGGPHRVVKDHRVMVTLPRFSTAILTPLNATTRPD